MKISNLLILLVVLSSIALTAGCVSKFEKFKVNDTYPIVDLKFHWNTDGEVYSYTIMYNDNGLHQMTVLPVNDLNETLYNTIGGIEINDSSSFIKVIDKSQNYMMIEIHMPENDYYKYALED